MAKPKRNQIPLVTMERILKKAGATKVSRSGKETLSKVTEKTAIEIAKKAVKLAKHGNRKTVKSSDIELAFEQS